MDEQGSTSPLGGLNNEQLEHAILAGIYCNPELYWTVSDILPREPITDPRYGEMAKAFPFEFHCLR